MKKWSLCLSILFLIACNKINLNGPHASILIRETTHEESSNPAEVSNESKESTLEKVDSIFLSESHINETLKKINNPDYKNASYIKKKIFVNQFENGIIHIDLYGTNPDFACTFLDSLFNSTIRRLENEDKIKLQGKSKEIQEKMDSCWEQQGILVVAYNEESDQEKKINQRRQMDICSARARELLTESIRNAGKIPNAGYSILAKASWIKKKK